MSNGNVQSELDRYIELTTWIRELSSPMIEDSKSAEEYRVDLLKSFNRIGELAKINQSILDEHFFSIVSSGDSLTAKEIEVLNTFRDALIDPVKLENIDLPILFVQTEKLIEDSKIQNDTRSVILGLDMMVIVCYAIFTATLRLYPPYKLGFEYREKGIDAASRLIEYLEPDKFKELDDECKEIVLINSRYITALFEWGDLEDISERARKDFAIMERSLNLAYDPFYLNEAKNYDWDYHIVRTLQYLACYTEFRDTDDYPKEVTEKICDYVETFSDELKSRCPELEEECTPVIQELYLLRNRYLAKRLSKEDYKSELAKIYNEVNVNNPDSNAVYAIFAAPYEYILLIDKENITEQDKEILRSFYGGLAKYVYHLPKASSLSFLMTFISCVFDEYIEVDGVPSLSEMCLDLMAVLHPPTYVHSLTVAEVTVCLASHLMEKDPAAFIGVLDTKTVDDVNAKKAEILEFVREATLLHDIGKIYIIETIITYGRRLLDMEFGFIKTHPEVGAYMLEAHEDTKEYADMARGHHKWFNDEGGYPEEFKLQDSKYKTIVSLLCVADCLDAATDTVGRNYKKSKSFDEYIDEIVKDRGSRYADFAVDLITEPEVRDEVERILETARDENYRLTYNLIKEISS